MKNCLKIVGIILIILIVIFAIHTIRNYVIITNLQNKIGTYINSDNYFIESSTKQGDAISTNLKCYKKGNKQVTFLDTISNGKIPFLLSPSTIFAECSATFLKHSSP